MTILYTPTSMLKAMKEMPKPDSFLRSMLIKSAPITSDKKHIELDKYTSKQGIAVYNSRTGAPTEVGKKGFATELHVSPYVNEVITMTPSDFGTRMEGETIYQSSASSQQAQKSIQYLKELNDRLDRLEEKQIVEAITSGTVTVANSATGVNYTVDYGMDDDNKETLTGDDVWGGDDSDILGNLQDWAKRLSNKGYVATDLFLDLSAANKLIADTTIKALLDNRRVMMGEINPRQIAGQRASYVGSLNAPALSIDIYCYMGGYETADDTFTNYLDSNRAIMVGAGVEIQTHYGKIENFNANFIGERFPNMWAENNGKVRYIGMESAPLEVLRNPNAVFSAKTGA